MVKPKNEDLVFYILAWELQPWLMVCWQTCFVWPTVMKKYTSCYQVIWGRVHLKCPASLENLEEQTTLGPCSRDDCGPGLSSSPLPPLPGPWAFWLTRGSTWWKFFFCFSIHSRSWPLKAFRFESLVPILRSDIGGGGRNLLIGPQTGAPPNPGRTTLGANRSKMKTCLCISFREKQVKEKNCLETFILMLSIIMNTRSCLLRTL